MEKEGKLIVFSAPSGSGKTTLVHHLLAMLPHKLDFSVSVTTRPKRGKEVHGEDYYYIGLKEFKKHLQQGDFVEWEEVYSNNFYGTLKKEIQRIWNLGKHVIFDIDVIGGLNIKKQYPDQTLAVFVQPPSLLEMERRLRNRKTDSEEKINERVQKASKEIKMAEKFDVVLINDDLDQAKQEAMDLVEKFIT